MKDGYKSRQSAYMPNLSIELRRFLEQQGTLQQFLNDYRQMCTNFKPSRMYIKDKEPKPQSYSELSDSQRAVLDKLGKKYAHALHSLLEVGLRLNNAKKEYALIGGMGVLSHLYSVNPKFPLKWRGTEDMDMLSPHDLSEFYKQAGFERNIAQERVDTNMIPDGKLVTYTSPNPWSDSPAKIQHRYSISFPRARKIDRARDIMKSKEIKMLYGVPISVASKEHLIETKTGIRTRHDRLGHLKDEHDITHLELADKVEQLLGDPKH